MLNCNRLVFNYSIDLIIDGVPVKCETKSKRNEINRNEIHRNEPKFTETKRNRNETKRNNSK